MPVIDSGGISVLAVQPGLLGPLGGSVSRGAFLNAATARYPVVVLGTVAAQTLGLDRVTAGTQVYLGGRYFTVTGILRPVPLAPQIDQAALVGFPVGQLGCSGWTAIPPRSTCGRGPGPGPGGGKRAPVHRQPGSARGGAARGGAGQPAVEHPGGPGRGANRVHRAVPRPGRGSRCWWAAIGIANIMVISVLERRGRDRAAPCARRHPVAGRPRSSSPRRCCSPGSAGSAGILLGAAATAGYAGWAGQPAVLPAAAVAGGPRRGSSALVRWPGACRALKASRRSRGGVRPRSVRPGGP